MHDVSCRSFSNRELQFLFKSAITYWIGVVQFLLVASGCYAQQINSIMLPDNASITLEELRNFSVMNVHESRISVTFELKLINSNGSEVYKSTSGITEIQPGTTVINQNSTLVFEQTFSNSNFKKSMSGSAFLPEGTYTLCVYVFSAMDNTEISSQCRVLNAVKGGNSSTSSNKNKNIAIGGQTNISGYYTDYVPVNSELSPASLQLNSRLMLDIYELPVNIGFLLSTDQSRSRQSINKINVSYDSKEFIRNLKQKVTDKIISDQKLMNSRNADILNSGSELNELNKKLAQPQIKNELEQIDQLKQLQHELDSSSDSSEIASLREKIRQYEELSQKVKGYERLLERKNELEGIVAKGKTADAALALKFDLKTLDDPDILKQKLSDYHLLKKSTQYLMWVNKFQLGTSIPDLTSLTLQNSPVNGIYTELQPGLLYVSVLYGKALNSVISPMAAQISYKRTVFGAGAGIGRKDFSHIHFYVLGFNDDSSSIRQTDSFAYYRLNPASNRVISADMQLNLFKNCLIFRTEIAGSQLVRNSLMPDKNEVLVDSHSVSGFTEANKWFSNIILQQHNSLYAAVDYAARFDATARINQTATSVNAGIQRTGRNFESFGIPYLRKDVVRYNFTMNQPFLNRKINLKVFLRLDEFDKSHQISSNSHYLFYGTDISVKFPKMPFFRFSVSPVSQISDSMQFELNTYSFSTGYSYTIGKSQLFSNLLLNRQKTVDGQTYWDYNANNISFIQNVNFSKTLSLNLNLSYIDFTMSDSTGNYTNIGFVAYYNRKKWQNQFGMNSFLYNQKKNKFGVFYQLMFPVTNYLQFMLRIERNVYDNLLKSEFYPDYEQWMMRGSLNVKF